KNPIIVQSMLKSKSANENLLKEEINDLVNCGCEIIRMAIPDPESLNLMGSLIREKAFRVPVVADIHFDPSLAIGALDLGADCVRVNPGNIGGFDRLEKIVNKAKEKNAAIRIGVNSGSIEKGIIKKNSGNILNSIVDSVMEIVGLMEKMKFYNFKISAKASSVPDTVSAYKTLASKIDYPLHVGLTEAGPMFTGAIKSAVGIGILLSEGIGDTIRVSLTERSVAEVKAAYTILSSLDLRHHGVNIISCPTCGRTRVDLKKIVGEVENMTSGIKESLNIAVMGCIVNGPGEAKDADLGIAYGIKKAAIFANGKINRRIEIQDVLKEFEKDLKNTYN
ncbi:MAG: flavodoxin-dependent (E)-4-hydroxy-3-methylbut-2-enyl-diphosphate synthase, partial [Actinobacteria bacterium]|nr:flavodoxin-dependent (E)-4-hydroxy-3-methylbut-2-enyl-diphosphate synthase [Actinomycetota bacterium]